MTASSSGRFPSVVVPINPDKSPQDGMLSLLRRADDLSAQTSQLDLEGKSSRRRKNRRKKKKQLGESTEEEKLAKSEEPLKPGGSPKHGDSSTHEESVIHREAQIAGMTMKLRSAMQIKLMEEVWDRFEKRAKNHINTFKDGSSRQLNLHERRMWELQQVTDLRMEAHHIAHEMMNQIERSPVEVLGNRHPNGLLRLFNEKANREATLAQRIARQTVEEFALTFYPRTCKFVKFEPRRTWPPTRDFPKEMEDLVDHENKGPLKMVAKAMSSSDFAKPSPY